MTSSETNIAPISGPNVKPMPNAAPINAISLTKTVEFVRAMTSWDVSLYELIQAGERADAMSRIFNVREGFTPADDTLPARLFEPMEGPLDGERVDPQAFEQALADLIV